MITLTDAVWDIIIELRNRLDKLEIIYNEFEGIQLEIESLSPDDVLESHYEERDKFTDKYNKYYAITKKMLNANVGDQISNNKSRSRSCSSSKGSYVMLSTVCAYIYDRAGNPHICNCWLDNGSRPNFVTSNLVRNLELDEIPVNISINGVSNVIANVRSKCNVRLASMHNNFNLKLSCYVFPTITGCLPTVKVNISDWKLPDNVFLADPKFNIPKQIDLLIAASHFWRIVRAGIIHLGKEMPVLQNTEFGYTVTGQINVPNLRQHLKEHEMTAQHKAAAAAVNNNNLINQFCETSYQNQQVQNMKIAAKELSNVYHNNYRTTVWITISK
ncbi:hypothetical protein ILUMI_26072 [Ignelater luminosus]|uniref:Peptidase aspartic putative domain-containing protein n=1 Tax=Ignelater luminosus TaxID=2038154 RepID=A0A8K0FZ12_IGNLU|nr:hypothetical protein ILUMI_26072 [Ignelater luminosus]